MNSLATTLFLLAVAAMLLTTKRWAPLVLFAGYCYLNMGSFVINVAGFTLPGFRLLVITGFLRILLRSESFPSRLNGIDKAVIAWAVWLLFASLFHVFGPGSGPQFSSGVVFNVAGVYFLLRFWCSGFDQIRSLIAALAVLLVPIACEMLQEKLTGRNLFAIFGGTDFAVGSRGGTLRAQGPFRHPILAGSVAAGCIPLMCGLWQTSRRLAITGLTACFAMVFASASSGPIMSGIFAIFATALWRQRHYVRHLRIAAVLGYLLLTVVMTPPAYYILARIDLAGGSTGWYRARLIQMTIEHFGEWWLFGTDVTSHWMPHRLNEHHADITNYYVQFAVWGGLLSLLLLLNIVYRGFKYVGRVTESGGQITSETRFMTWCLGSALFAHAATCLSVSYDGQAGLFLWSTLALISASYSALSSIQAPVVTTDDPEFIGKAAPNCA